MTGSVTIAAGLTTADINVAVINDALVEAIESVIVTLTGFSANDPDITLHGTAANRTVTVNISDDDVATVSIAMTSGGAEPATNGRFTVTQTAVSAVDTTLTYTIGGTADNGLDYAILTGSVTIAAGQTTADINVEVIDDALVEGDQSLIITLTGFDAGDGDITLDTLAANRTAEVTIEDDDAVIVSIAQAVNAAEPATNGKFTVVQTAPSSTATVVTYVITGTALYGTDFTMLIGSVTIVAGQTAADIDVTILDEALVEGTESVVLTLTGLTAHDPEVILSTQLFKLSATVDISDDDVAMVSIATVVNGAEPSTNAKFTVTQSALSSTDTVVIYSVTGSAINGSDYTTLTGFVTILAGQTSADINVAMINDALVEATESIIVTLTGFSAGDPDITLDAAAANRTAMVNITDNDSATVSIAKVSDGAEPGTNGKFTVTQTEASSTDTVLTYTITGTAANGSDYTTLTGSVTIAAGQTTTDINVSVLNDALVEATESVIVTLSGFSAGDADIALDGMAANRTATVSITDNDTAAVSIAKVSDGAEPGTSGKFTVTQTAASSTDTVVTYTITGTAANGSDYTTLTGSVTIAAGQTTADINVLVLNDALVEATESVIVTLTGLSAGDADIALDGTVANRTATVNITDNDAATVSIAKILDGAEPSPNGMFTVTQSAISSTDTIINYTVTGAAANGSDYTTLTGSVTVLAGQTVADINVAVINDALVEATESVIVTLTGFNAGDPDIALDVTAANRTATVNITDNDTATLSIAKVSDGAEPGTNGKFTVTQTAASSTDTVVTYTITGTAANGSDYTTLTGSVTIAAGQTMADINVSVLNDVLVEATESVIVTLIGFSAGDADVVLDGTAAKRTATVNITDNDSATVSIAKVSDGAEPGTNGKFTVTQTAASSTDTVLTYSITGTATNGLDYTTLTGFVTIAAGQTTADIDVVVINDAIVEAIESMILTLTGISGGDTDIALDGTAAKRTATVNIADSDSATVSIAKILDGAEPSSNGKFTVTQSAISSTDTIINYTVTGTAANGSDYTTLTGSVKIAAGQNTADINVSVIDDLLVEATESLIVTLTGFTVGDADIALDGMAANRTATVNITDNDTATLSIAKVSDGAEPGTNGKFTVTQTVASSTDTVVTYTITGTAANGSDYTTLTGSVTIAAGQTTADINVSILNDVLVEATESVIVTLTGFSAGDADIALDGTVANRTATVSITDNDAGTVSIAKVSDSAESASNGKFTVTQTTASSTDTVLTYSITGTTTNGLDYTPLTGFVTIAAGQTAADINVAVINDSLIEATESVVVTLTGISGGDVDIALDGTAAKRTATVNITDNDSATISIAQQIDGSEPSGGGNFVVTQTGVSATDTVVTYAITGTAINDVDYSRLTGSVTILAGQTTAVINVAVINDALVEATEAVIVTLTGFNAGDLDIALNASATNRTATVNIGDDDAATVSIVKINDGAEAGSNATFMITQTAVSATDTVVIFAITGTTDNGVDYATLTGFATIAAGQTTAEISVIVANDSVVEATESLIVTLTGFSAGDGDIGLDGMTFKRTAAVNITDNDTATVSIVKIIDGAELGTDGKFKVLQTAPSSTDTVVTYIIAGTAINGGDYTPLTGSVTITAGLTSADINVTMMNDAVVETTESVIVTLTGISAGDADIALNGTPANSTATLNIIDNDRATVSIAKTIDGAEPATNGMFTVTQTAVSSSDTVVTYAIMGSAINGIDYAPVTESVTIFAGQTTVEIIVAVINDSRIELAESVLVILDAISAGDPDLALDGSADNRTASVYITDDDVPTVSIATITNGHEADTPQNGKFRVMLSEVSPIDLVVTYSIGGTAKPGVGEDYAALSGTITIPAGQAGADLEVRVFNDHIVEETETVTLMLTGLGGGIAGNLTATVTMTDDDPIVIISPTVVSVAENSSNSLIVLDVDAAAVPGRTLTYSLSGPDAVFFDINPATGIITLRNSLDFETPTDQGGDNTYRITVAANASFAIPRPTLQNVTINVTPVNDNGPVLVDDSLVFVIPENLPAGTMVGDILATDGDLPREVLTYSIIGGNASNAFSVDAATGRIAVADTTQLNFETTTPYTLQIRVTDNGSPTPRSTDGIVSVSLTNVLETHTITTLNQPDIYRLGQAFSLVSPDATLKISDDVHSPDFLGVKLTVSTSRGHSARDIISIVKNGDSAGQIFTKGTKVFQGSIQIGTFVAAKGKKHPDLVVIFNSNANAEALESVMRRLSFRAKDQVGVARTLQMQITNLAGIESNVATRIINVL